MSEPRGTESPAHARHPRPGRGLGPVRGAWGRLPPVVRRFLPLAGVLAVALAYPYVVADLRGPGEVGVFFPQLGSVVIILVFTLMSVGPDVAVGYCGLLDLG